MKRELKRRLGIGAPLIKDIDTLQQAPGTLVMGEITKLEPKERDPNELYSFDDYSNKIADDVLAFQKQFGYPYLGTIFYPCSGHDPRLFLTFKKSRVIQIDKDLTAVKTLKTIGVEAYHASVDAFDFEATIGNKANLVYILNPQVKFTKDWVDNSLEIDGYIICNNYHETAIYLYQFNSLKIVGIMQGNNLVGEVETDVIKKIIRYRKEKPNVLWTPYMDHRFIYRKIK